MSLRPSSSAVHPRRRLSARSLAGERCGGARRRVPLRRTPGTKPPYDTRHSPRRVHDASRRRLGRLCHPRLPAPADGAAKTLEQRGRLSTPSRVPPRRLLGRRSRGRPLRALGAPSRPRPAAPARQSDSPPPLSWLDHGIGVRRPPRRHGVLRGRQQLEPSGPCFDTRRRRRLPPSLRRRARQPARRRRQRHVAGPPARNLLGTFSEPPRQRHVAGPLGGHECALAPLPTPGRRWGGSGGQGRWGGSGGAGGGGGRDQRGGGDGGGGGSLAFGAGQRGRPVRPFLPLRGARAARRLARLWR